MDGLSSSRSLTLVEPGRVSQPDLPGVGLTGPGRSEVQHTLKNPIDCVGVGLHCGRPVALKLLPAAPDTGIVFRRTDLPAGTADIPARFDMVSDTRLCTVLGGRSETDARVGTTEHLLAALAGCGVHNALIEINGPEVPILDGSAECFVFLIDCAGTVAQDVPVSAIEVLRPVRVAQGDAYAELLPGGPGLDMTMSIDFEAPAIGCQSASVVLTPGAFRSTLARARTFTLASEVASLRRSGLALGGSLQNAIVVDGDCIANPGGLRMPDEFVRHKLLDVVGDLSLSGMAINGRFVGHRSGHALNNRLLRALFADDANWAPVFPYGSSFAGGAAMSGWREGRLAVAASPA